jgi:hypothetical protein
MHEVRICYLDLITNYALSVLHADFVQTYCMTLQNFCNEIPVQPVLARPPCQHHKPKCDRTQQTLRPCPTPPGSKWPSSQPHVSARHGAAKMKFAKLPLFDPFWRAYRTETMPPDAPKLGKLGDLVWNHQYLESKLHASFLASTSLPPKCALEFAVGASFM